MGVMGVPGVIGMIGGVRVLGDVGGFGGVGGIRPGKCGQKKSSWLFTDGYVIVCKADNTVRGATDIFI